MSGDVHVRICERLGVRLPRATRPILVCRKSGAHALEAFEAIASRMGLTINRGKTRVTKLIEGFDFIGFEFVKRRSPQKREAEYLHLSQQGRAAQHPPTD